MEMNGYPTSTDINAVGAKTIPFIHNWIGDGN